MITGHSGQTPEDTPQSAKPVRRILVVDDNKNLRQLMKQVLLRAGYEVDAAEDGAFARDSLELNEYDLMITDNRMPKMTGVELLRKIRAARMELPVIMVTGTLPAHEFAESPWLIPDAVLLQPFVPEELLGKVQTVLCLNGDQTIKPSSVPPSPPL